MEVEHDGTIKSQTPNTKLQTPKKLQTSNSKPERSGCADAAGTCLELVI
jgi:hypothetical protein